MGKPATDSKVYEPPGLAPATVLRPEVIARLELLRIVWRPDRTAADAVKVCEELEKYVSGSR
jgi:hypothetical protein